MSTYPQPADPLAVARQFIAENYTHSMSVPGIKEPRKTPTLGYWRGSWYQYAGTHWDTIPESDVRLKLYEVLETATFEVEASNEKGDGDKGEVAEHRKWTPTKAKIGNVMEPVELLAKQQLPDQADAPYWVSQFDDQEPASDYVCLQNGRLHLPTRNLEEHHPELFTTWALPFDYDKRAMCPEWDKFLKEIFKHDPKGKELLQEYAGYLISGRTDLHKALLIVGPARAGKGTVSRIFKQLVGMENTASPSLHSLGSDFGLEPLIGKPFAVIEDARGDDDGRSKVTTERILNITGEDQMSINIKHRHYWNGTLPTRLMLVSNEVPRFSDAAGAITNRFMSIELVSSFLGREDPNLGKKLSAELPGILNWALDGLTRLEKTNNFTVSDSQEETRDLMADMASPVERFLREHYEKADDPNAYVPLGTVNGIHERYKRYCTDKGLKAVSQSTFHQRVNAAGISWARVKNGVPPGIDKEHGKKERHLPGVRIKCQSPPLSHTF